jgi:gluconate 5-dehydrogenase
LAPTSLGHHTTSGDLALDMRRAKVALRCTSDDSVKSRGRGQGIWQGKYPDTVAGTAAPPARRHPTSKAAEDERQRSHDVRHTAAPSTQTGWRGKIITVGSVRGEFGHPGGYSAYGTAKGAVHLLTKQLSTEWAKYQINVNSIAPCIFWTPLTQHQEDPELSIFGAHPVGPLPIRGLSVLAVSSSASLRDRSHPSVDGGAVAG